MGFLVVNDNSNFRAPNKQTKMQVNFNYSFTEFANL